MKKALPQRFYSCFFTGHRILGDCNNRNRIYEALVNETERLVEECGVDTFICGGAIGFDALAAKAVIYLKEKNPDVKLKLYIPCYNHFFKWSYKDKAVWRYISTYTDESIYITAGPYEDGCMKKRNYAMVDDAYYCLAYCIKSVSGTGSTLRYAELKNCKINNIADII